MYTVIKRMEVSAAHSLKLSYRSKCENLHGHNWIITVYCRSKELNADGMVVDFSHIKQVVKEQLDHHNLNEVLSFNPHSREHSPLDMRPDTHLLQGRGAGVGIKHCRL